MTKCPNSKANILTSWARSSFWNTHLEKEETEIFNNEQKKKSKEANVCFAAVASCKVMGRHNL